MKQTFKFSTSDTMSRLSRECRPTLGRLSTLFLLLFALSFGFNQEAKAGTSTTVYYAVDATTVGCYTVKYNANKKGDGEAWINGEMTKTSNTINGKIVYKATFTDDYDGLGTLQFQLWDGSTWKSQVQPISTWTSASTYNKKVFTHGGSGWNTPSYDASYTIYFADYYGWGNDHGGVKAYAWNSACDYNAAWNGKAMTATDKTYNGKTIYSITIDKRYTKVKINAANHSDYATGDLDCYSNSGKICIYNGSAYKWVTYNYDVKVTFNNGTSDVDTKTLLKGGTTTAPADPSKTGYTFGGWWNGSNQFVSGTTTINADITYTAKWTPKTYTLYLDPNGGSGETQSVTVTYNSNTITGSITNPTAPAGYYFYGWRTGTSGGSLIIYNNQLQSNKSDYTDASGNWIKDDNATLYAQWKESTYNITVQSNNTDYGTVAAASVKAGQITSVALPAASVTSSTYKFVNWTATDGITITNANSADGATITATKAGTVTANFALAATYDLTLQAGTGIAAVSGGKTGQATLPFSSNISATAQTGYTFATWTKTGGKGSVSYTSGSATSANATVSVSIGSVTLTASATPNQYIITYKDKGGSNYSGSNLSSLPATHTFGTATTLVDGVRTGYTFGGWFTNQDCTGSYITSLSAEAYTDNITLYAKWTPNQYIITYKDKGGSNYSGSNLSSLPATHTFGTATTLVDGVRTGYTFGGWFTNQDCTGSYITSLSAEAYTDNITLYAKWTEVLYDVTINSSNEDGATLYYDGAYHEWGSVVQVGLETKKNITVTPNPGYKLNAFTQAAGGRVSGSVTDFTVSAAGANGTVTANPVTTPTIFFDNRGLKWSDVYVHFNPYWDTDHNPSHGAGSNGRHTAHMTQIGSTGIYYYSYDTKDENAIVAFTQASQSDYSNFHETKVAYREDFNECEPLFIPSTTRSNEFNSCDYFSDKYNVTGNWDTYSTTSKYYLLGLGDWTEKDDRKLTKPNALSSTQTISISLNANITYEFKFKTCRGTWYGVASATTITSANCTDIPFVAGDDKKNCSITTTIAGTYTFTFDNNTKKLSVEYPAMPAPESITVTAERYYGEDKISTFIATDPYTVYTDEKIKLTIDEVAAPTGCTTYYQFGDNAASTERTYTISNITTTASSIEAKVFFRPNSGGKDGDATTETINYQGMHTPTLYLTTSWSNDEAQEGSDVPDNVTIFYNTANYSGPATVTRSKDGAPAETFFTVPDGTQQMNQIYNLPDQNVQRQTFVATATANSRTFTATKAVSIYRLVEITITDEHHWMDHYYMWENGTNPLHEETAWPGNNFFSTLGNAHIFYVKYPSYTHFVLNNGRAATEDDAAQTIDVTVPNQSTCYTIGEKITAEGDDKGKYAVQEAVECPNKLYVGDIADVSAVQGEGVMVSPQVDIDPLLDANNLTISFDYGSIEGITCDQRGRSFMVTATAGTGTYNIHVTYSIPGADPITKPVTIKVTSAIMIQAKYGDLGWVDHYEIYIHYWGTDINATQKMTWKDYVGEAPNKQDRVYARIPLDSEHKINFQIYAWNMDEDWHVTKDVTGVASAGCYTITPDDCQGCKRNITRDDDYCWTAYYVEIDMNNGTVYRSNTVEDLTKQVSFFAPGSSESQAKAGAVRIICNGSQTVVVPAATFTKSGIYTAKITANGEGLSDVASYTGDYYIRTDGVEGGWDNYKQESHKFTYFTPYKDALYDYYWVKNIKKDGKLNIKACVGNDINENLANMIEADNYTDAYGDITPDASTGVNLRFGYNPETNYFERSILRGSTAGSSNFLNLVGNNIFNNKSCTEELNEANYTDHAAWSKFDDISNWVYEKNVYVKIEGAQQSAQALLKSKAFNGTTIYQLGYTLDNFGRQTGTPAQRDILGSGTTNSTYNIRIIYDFKTNRIVSAWSPVGDVTYSTSTTIEADVLFVRHEDTPVAQVNLDNDAALVSNLNSAYFVMEIDGSSDKASESIYWFSVPFDCEISSIFGVEGYVTLDGNGNPTAGTWGIQEYDGEARAQKGWYIEDTQTFWRWMRKNETLKKGNGYVLVFDRADADNKGLWSSISREEPCEGTDDGCKDGKKTVATTVLRLYFPSSESGWKMTRSSVDQSVTYEDWTCQKKNRKAQDSNWRLLGTDSYSDIMITKQAQFHRLDDDSVVTKAPNFVYVYDRSQSPYNRYAPVTSVGKNFQSFNCYMVQFSGTINWNQYTQSEHDQNVVARRVVAENELTNAQMTLSLKKGNNTEDNTYIYMDTRATTDFDNQMDLTKITDTRANHIYSVINEVEYAGNTLPVEDQIVPITVNVNANGAYTFAMPEMTDGLEVYLMDNATNAHIDMAIDSYTVDLNKGKIADRFYLDVRVKERTTPTIIETIGTDGNPTGDRFIKVIQNDQLHIIRNGRIYNASGMELNR